MGLPPLPSFPQALLRPDVPAQPLPIPFPVLVSSKYGLQPRPREGRLHSVTPRGHHNAVEHPSWVHTESGDYTQKGVLRGGHIISCGVHIAFSCLS